MSLSQCSQFQKQFESAITLATPLRLVKRGFALTCARANLIKGMTTPLYLSN